MLFSDPIFPILFCVVFAVAFVVVLVRQLGQRTSWKDLPTLEEYGQAHPECKTQSGIRCMVCKGGSIRDWGVYSAHSSMRKFICNSCGSELYRL